MPQEYYCDYFFIWDNRIHISSQEIAVSDNTVCPLASILSRHTLNRIQSLLSYV